MCTRQRIRIHVSTLTLEDEVIETKDRCSMCEKKEAHGSIIRTNKTWYKSLTGYSKALAASLSRRELAVTVELITAAFP